MSSSDDGPITVIGDSELVGSVIYGIAVAMALNADFLGFNASDLNLITAVLVAVALILPRLRARIAERAGKARSS